MPVQEYFNPKLEEFEIVNIKPKRYKTKMRVTSLLAFVDLLEDLGLKEMQVLQAVKKIQPCSDKMIRENLGWKINCVTGRRNSLSNWGVLIQYKKDIDKIPPFKKVIYWKIPEWMNGILL